MIDRLSQIKDTIGMDSNYFYPLLVTIIIAFLPFIKSLFSYNKNRRTNNLLDLHKTEESDFFYVGVILIEGVLFYFNVFLLVFVELIIEAVFSYAGFDLQVIRYILIIIFLIIIGWMLVKKVVMKFAFVRKRILGEDSWRWLIYAPVMCYNLLYVCICFFPQYRIVYLLINILFGILGIIGLFRFQGRYIRYEYSSLNIYTNSGDKIECEDISKIRRKSEILIIGVKNREIYVNYKDISKIEYQGKERIILKKFFERG